MTESELVALAGDLRALAASVAANRRADEKLLDERHKEIERRLAELNNSHAQAVAEKRRTDETALRVQENSVSKEHLALALAAMDVRLGEVRDWRNTRMGNLATEGEQHVASRWLIGLAILVLVNIGMQLWRNGQP